MEWRLVVDQSRHAQEHMLIDNGLARAEVPSVRWFVWNPPAISLAWKQPHPDWLKISQWEAQGLEVVERPTGGGIAFHGSDISLAVVVPHRIPMTLAEIMAAICDSVVRLCRALGVEATTCDIPGEERITYCLAQPSTYAIIVGSKKLAGFAIRR